MSIEFVILLGIISTVVWAGVSYLCWRCGYIEGLLAAKPGHDKTRSPRPPSEDSDDAGA